MTDWGWKLTLHIYGSGELPDVDHITAAAEAASEIVEADDFVGSEVRIEHEPPRIQGNEKARLTHLPTVVADQFGIPRSEARRRISLGRVKLNGQVVTDLDVDLDAIPEGDPVRIEVESHPLSDGLVRELRAQQEGDDHA